MENLGIGEKVASSIIILKPVDRYSVEKTMIAFEKAIMASEISLNKMEIEYDLEKKIIGAEGYISFMDYTDHSIKPFLFTINDIDAYSEDSFEWLVPGKRLFWAIDIEDIGGYPRQIFKLAINYFLEDPNDFLWLDSLRWAYSAKEIEMLSKMPYQENWLYEKVQRSCT